MKRYFKYVKPYLFYFIAGPLLMILEVVGEVVLPALMAKIINVGAPDRNIGYIVGVGAVMAVFSFFMMLGGIGGAYFASKAAMNFGADLRKDLSAKGCV